jgi:alkylation response protein AidB-like acyl-CoA dehydrogenase
MTLLDFERSGISAAAEQEADFDELLHALREEPGSLLERSAPLRARVADLAIAIDVGYQLALRVASMQAAGQVPSHEASMGKTYSTELGQRLYALGVRAFGLYSNLWPGERRAPLAGKHTHQYLRSVPLTLVGGTSEVQRNIVATRGLGLPRS